MKATLAAGHFAVVKTSDVAAAAVLVVPENACGFALAVKQEPALWTLYMSILETMQNYVMMKRLVVMQCLSLIHI